jgi:hypothetical protein
MRFFCLAIKIECEVLQVLRSFVKAPVGAARRQGSRRRLSPTSRVAGAERCHGKVSVALAVRAEPWQQWKFISIMFLIGDGSRRRGNQLLRSGIGASQGGCRRAVLVSSRADEFRKNADECRQQAERSHNPADKERWFMIAEHWLQMAQEETRPDEASPR